MKTVRLLCHRNGVGLSWDGEIIRGLLKSHGYSVQWDDPNWKDRGSGSFDLVIHCEIVYPGYMSAPKRIFIPNPEWFYPDWKRHLKDYTVIACKTKDAQRIFQKLNCPTRHVSFTSQDRYDPDVEKKLKFVHFAGQSYNKGTTETLRAFGQGGSPKLNVFSRDPTTFKWVAGVNAEIHVGSLSDEQMKL